MNRSVMFVGIVGIVASLTCPVRAELIQFEFRGKVKEAVIFLSCIPPWDSVKVNDSWSIKFVFDSDLPPNLGEGGYRSLHTPYTFTMGDGKIQSTGQCDIIVDDDVYDLTYGSMDYYAINMELADGSWFAMHLFGPSTIWDSHALPGCGDINLKEFDIVRDFSLNAPPVPPWLGGGHFAGSVKHHDCKVIKVK